MIRTITVSVLLACALGQSSAQRAKPEPAIKAELRDGEWVWKLDASGEMDLNAVISLYAESRDLQIIYDEKKLGGLSMWKGPAFELTGEEIDLFVANSLEQYRLVLAPAGATQMHIVYAAEIATRSRFVAVSDLDAARQWEWVLTYFVCRYVDPVHLRSKLQNVITREGGVLNPYPGGGVLICDRVDRIRNMLPLASAIDEEFETEILAHPLPDSIDAAAAVAALRELFDREAKFTVAPDGKRVVARVRPHQHADVTKAIEAMM